MDEQTVIRDHLLAYFKEMYEWETRHFQSLRERYLAPCNIAMVMAKAKEELLDIYSRFLTEKDRRNVAYHRPIRKPTAYDPQKEHIVKIAVDADDNMVARTIFKGITTLGHQYIFVKEGNEWRIDHKQTYWHFKREWDEVPV